MFFMINQRENSAKNALLSFSDFMCFYDVTQIHSCKQCIRISVILQLIKVLILAIYCKHECVFCCLVDVGFVDR